MNRPVASFALLLTLAGLVLAAPDGDSLVGKWKVHDGKGKPSGHLNIERAPQGNHRFLLHWQVDTGAYDGVALLRQGHLYSGWGRGANGVMLFRKDGDSWKADWVGVNHAEEVLGSETLRGAAIEGDHEVTGRAPNGNEYSGVCKVERTGETLAFDWKVGERTYQGVGLACGDDKVVVAYGQGNFGVIEYDVSGNGESFTGRWAARGDRAIGTERLTPARGNNR